ncbi:MAG: hypothetical protein ACTHZ5_08885 [Micrococcaceae bacterium]
MGPDDRTSPSPPVIECLCVHGIGVRGTETGHTARVVADCVQRGVHEAGGRFTTLSDADAGRAEARAEVRARIQLAEHDVVVRFHDLAWHHLVESPRLRDVFWWALRIAPLTPMIVAAAWSQDRAVEDRIRPRAWHRIDQVMSTCLVLIAGLVALLAVVPVGLVSGLIAIPVAPVRERLRRILVEVLGDAWLYRSNHFEAEVIPHLVGRARSLAQDGGWICLIGHSQGGEIARRISLSQVPAACVAVGTGEAPLGMLRTLGSNPLAWILYWAFYAAFPAFFVWMAREAFAVIDAIVAAVSTPMAGFSPAAHTSAVVPALFFVLLAALIGSTVRRPADLGQRADCLNVQVKSLLDPISYGSSNSGDVLRFQPPSGRAANLLEHTQYFTSVHTGLFLAETLLGSQAVPAARRWCAARFTWWLRLLGALATALLVGILWMVGSWQLDIVLAWLG